MMENKKSVVNVYDFISMAVSAVIIVAVIFTFFFKISTVSGKSMENTLHNGDQLIISAIPGEIEYGDVVVVSQPNVYSKVLIKRVIAVGGQTIKFDAVNNQVSVDGKVVDEPYIKEEMEYTFSTSKEYVVPEGKLFLMGDNRNFSADSRDIRIGMVDEDYVVGKVIYRFGDKAIFNSDFMEAYNG